MAGTELSGVVVTSTGPYNGATVDAWLASRFGSAPGYNATPPAGSPDGGPVTTGTTFGGPGSWTITGVADGSYYVRAQISGTSSWTGPVETTADADILHKSGAETKTGLLTLSAGLTVSGGVLTVPAGSIGVAALTGVLPIANGGTGSATQPFVDLTTAQTKAGALTLSNTPILNAGLNVTAGPVTFPNGSIAQAAVAGAGTPSAGVDIGSSQIVTGQKTFDNDVPIVGGQLLGSALATPPAPVVTQGGTTGSTTYQYKIVGTAYDGRDTIPSPVGQTTTGNATLTGSNYNALTWSAVTGAATYKVLRNISGTYQLLVSGLTATSYNDNGSATASAYTAQARNPGGEINALGIRNVGSIPTTGPAATSGPYLSGDYGVDSTGKLWTCQAGGTPGTWFAVGPGDAALQVTQGTPQTITNATYTVVAFDVVNSDQSSGWSPANHNYTVPVSGRYTVSWAVGLAALATNMLSSLFVNGGEARRGAQGTLFSSPGSTSEFFAAGTTLDIRVLQASGGSMNTPGLGTTTFFEVVFLGGRPSN